MANVLDKLRSGAMWGVLGQTGTGFIMIGNTGLISRIMTMQDVGFYFFLLSLARMLMNLTAAGTHRGLLKEAAIAAETENWRAVRRIAGLSAILIAASTAIVWATMSVGWPIFDRYAFDNRLPVLIWILFLLIVLGRGLEIVFSSFFRAVRWSTYGILMLNLPREVLFTIVLAIVLLTVVHAPLMTVMLCSIGVLSTVLLVNVVMLIRFYARHPAQGETGSVPSLRAYAGLCLPAMLQGTATLVLANVATWVLGFVRPPEDVAIYGVALQLTNLISFLLIVVNLVLPPMVAVTYHKRQMHRLHYLVRTASSWTTFCAAGGVLFYAVLGPWLISTLYGAKYLPAYSSLVILAIGQAVNAALGSPGVILEMTGHQAMYLKLSIAGVTVGIVASLLLVPDYGPVGAAYSTMAAIMVQKAAMTWCAYRYAGVWTLPGLKMFAPKRLIMLVHDSRKRRKPSAPATNDDDTPADH